MGIHGEKGVALLPWTSADALVPQMLDILYGDDLPLNSGDEVLLFVNSLGSTTMMELLILNRRIKQLLRERGLVVVDTIIGPLVTCQEMAGFSITVMKMDDELKKYWAMPCQSVCYTKMAD